MWRSSLERCPDLVVSKGCKKYASNSHLPRFINEALQHPALIGLGDSLNGNLWVLTLFWNSLDKLVQKNLTCICVKDLFTLAVYFLLFLLFLHGAWFLIKSNTTYSCQIFTVVKDKDVLGNNSFLISVISWKQTIKPSLSGI